MVPVAIMVPKTKISLATEAPRWFRTEDIDGFAG